MANQVKNNITQGNVCEFGVFYGYTFNLLLDFFGKDFNFYGYDSFIGLSEPDESNDNVKFNCCRKNNMAVSKNTVLNYLNSSTQNNDQLSIKLIEGYVNDTVPYNLPETICFDVLNLRVDLTNLYYQHTI